MSRKWIGGLVAVAAIGAGRRWRRARCSAPAARADRARPTRPSASTWARPRKAPATARRAGRRHKTKKKKPKVVYLQSPTPGDDQPAPSRRGWHRPEHRHQAHRAARR